MICDQALCTFRSHGILLLSLTICKDFPHNNCIPSLLSQLDSRSSALGRLEHTWFSSFGRFHLSTQLWTTPRTNLSTLTMNLTSLMDWPTIMIHPIMNSQTQHSSHSRRMPVFHLCSQTMAYWVEFYDKRTRTGLVASLMIRDSTSTPPIHGAL